MKLEIFGSVEYTHGIGLEYRNPANDGGQGADSVWTESWQERTTPARSTSGMLADLRAEAALMMLGLPEAVNVNGGSEMHFEESRSRHTQSLPPQTDRDLEWTLSKMLRTEVSLDS